MLQDYDHPPTPTQPYEAGRVETVRRRERLLTGAWDLDLEQRLHQQFGGIRRGAMGPQSKALNVFKRVCEELAVLYNEPPEVSHASGEFDELLATDGLIDRAGLWPSQRRNQVHTLGARESIVRVGWSERHERPAYTRVSAASVRAWSLASDPGRPIRLQQLQWYPGRKKWATPSAKR